MVNGDGPPAGGVIELVELLGERDRSRLADCSSAGIWFRFLDPLTRESIEKEKGFGVVVGPDGGSVVRLEDMWWDAKRTCESNERRGRQVVSDID